MPTATSDRPTSSPSTFRHAPANTQTRTWTDFPSMRSTFRTVFRKVLQATERPSTIAKLRRASSRTRERNALAFVALLDAPPHRQPTVSCLTIMLPMQTAVTRGSCPRSPPTGSTGLSPAARRRESNGRSDGRVAWRAYSLTIETPTGRIARFSMGFVNACSASFTSRRPAAASHARPNSAGGLRGGGGGCRRTGRATDRSRATATSHRRCGSPTSPRRRCFPRRQVPRVRPLLAFGERQ